MFQIQTFPNFISNGNLLKNSTLMRSVHFPSQIIHPGLSLTTKRNTPTNPMNLSSTPLRTEEQKGENLLLKRERTIRSPKEQGKGRKV
ncbi:hypothetical protein CDAR_550741 [Caerostris darwini]|uniref:Uncharacterized protein n=1 Tax=Caerostris darwini TaxID=1538125 RepID=A0AAV4PGZ7_9ARAC|nr:hypothetical protein CDAR_550741 [Caerostris darwini]